MRRALALFLLTALVIGAAWILWRAFDSEVDSPTPPARKSAEVDRVARQEATESAFRPAPRQVVARKPDPARKPAAMTENFERDGPVHRRGPRLLVIDGRNGEPIPGATVGMVNWRDVPVPWRGMWFYRLLSFDQVVRRFGSRGVTDADGRIALPAFLDVLVVGCRHAGLWTRQEIALERPPMDGVWRLVLESECRLEVLVTDGIGRPQEAVGLSLEVENDGDGVTTDGRDLRVWTAANGHAAFLLREALRIHARKGDRIHVRLEVPGVQSERCEIKLEPWPRGPIKFVLPPTGRVEVTVRGENGPPRMPCPVRLKAQVGGVCRSVTRNGVAVFPHVGLGRSLRISVDSPRGKDLLLRGAGPIQAGETVSFSAVVDDSEAWIIGRAAGAGGAAGPAGMNARLEWVVKIGGTTFRSFGMLDAGGRFRMRRSSFMDRHPTMKVRLQTLDWRGIREQSAWRDVIPGPGGDLDVGTFALVPAPLWARGQVLDETGAPMPWVEVRIDYRDAWRLPLLPGAIRVVRGKNSAMTRRYHTRTDAEGRFEVRGPLPKGTFDVEFVKRFAATVKRRGVTPATTGMIITITRFGEIVGRVRTAAPLDPARVVLRAVRRGDRKPLAIAPETSGRFRSDQIRPGGYDVGVFVIGATEPVLTIPDVKVAGGRRTVDPRLEEVDLRGRVAQITLTLRGPNGEVPEDAVLWLGGRGMSWHEVKTDVRGQAPVWTGPQGIEVEATAPGYRRRRVRGVNADCTLTLVRGIPVRLRYNGTERVPDRAVVLLRVQLEEEAPGHDHGARWPGPRALVAAHPRDTVSLDLPLPGRYRVEVSLRDRANGRTPRALAASTPHVILAEIEIEVRDVTGSQTFPVRVDRNAMLEGIEEFREAITDGDDG